MGCPPATATVVGFCAAFFSASEALIFTANPTCDKQHMLLFCNYKRYTGVSMLTIMLCKLANTVQIPPPFVRKNHSYSLYLSIAKLKFFSIQCQRFGHVCKRPHLHVREALGATGDFVGDQCHLVHLRGQVYRSGLVLGYGHGIAWGNRSRSLFG